MLLHDAKDERLRRLAATIHADPRLRLAPEMVREYTREIFAARTRADLATIVRRIWAQFDNGLEENAEQLKYLRADANIRRHDFDVQDLEAIRRRVEAATTSEELEDITRAVWPKYSRGDRGFINRSVLRQLRELIERRRAIVEPHELPPRHTR